ncbi:GntR family transcriptional regulator [Gryllotalpicola reticulitermitis]|uniref:GntR family transcriptional regulator n=1 Tax=Gryllotalpicola reticulitermitis TaxID=1184153 RepID=A0ABV8Q5H9_9MICO
MPVNQLPGSGLLEEADLADAGASPAHPRYYAIATELQREIATGAFALGSVLPAEHRLAARFGVSRDTVRKALERLQQRGVVVSRHGVGWLVQSSLHTQPFSVLRSFAQWAQNRGLTPGGRRVSQERGFATLDEARTLHLARGAAVLRVTRVRTLDDRPVMLERTTYAPWVAAVVESLPADVPSVVAAMEQAGIMMVFGQHHIDAVPASSDDARLLAIRRSSPLLRVRRETYGHDGKAIEHGEDRYLPGTIQFEVDSSAANATVGQQLL